MTYLITIHAMGHTPEDAIRAAKTVLELSTQDGKPTPGAVGKESRSATSSWTTHPDSDPSIPFLYPRAQ